jgi:glycosyltransferase involved in cell wall biosynthesis
MELSINIEINRFMCKHSVLIISYNQEKSIANSIESLLIQKEFLHEIIISDDYSQDKTMDIILNYQTKHPLLIKSFRQDFNVGIFKNLEYGLTQISGDVVSILAGDDTLNNGVFEEMNKVIKENFIDLKNDCFNIIFNHEIVFPDESIKLIDNYKVRNIDAFKLKIRNLLNNRDMGISMNILKQIPILPEDLGLSTDGIFDDYIFYFANKNLYSSFIGEKYYAGIGISSRTDSNSKTESMIKVLEFIENAYRNKLDKNDLAYLKIEKMYFSLKYKFSFFLWVRILVFSIFNPGCFIVTKKYFKFLLFVCGTPFKKVFLFIKKLLLFW